MSNGSQYQELKTGVYLDSNLSGAIGENVFVAYIRFKTKNGAINYNVGFGKDGDNAISKIFHKVCLLTSAQLVDGDWPIEMMSPLSKNDYGEFLSRFLDIANKTIEK